VFNRISHRGNFGRVFDEKEIKRRTGKNSYRPDPLSYRGKDDLGFVEKFHNKLMMKKSAADIYLSVIYK
jgi:hypothetical protein